MKWPDVKTLRSKTVRRALIAALCVLLYLLWRAAYTFVFLRDGLDAAGMSTDAEMTVESFSEPASYGLSAYVRFKGVRTLLYYSSDELLEPGDMITARVRVDRLDHYSKGAHLRAATRELSAVQRPARMPLRHLPAHWARAIRAQIDAVLPQELAPLLKGILTGDRSGFSPALASDLSATGLSHVAAVSGLHVSMLLGLIVLLVGNRRRAVWAGLPLIWAFVAVTGFSPSAVRAGIMITMMLLAPLLGREYDAMAALCAALVLLLAADPYAIGDIGLQMSFLSTLGLVLFSGRTRAFVLRRLPRALPGGISRVLASTLGASLSALVFTVPVIAYRFGAVSLIAPLANLLLLWMVNLIFVSGAVAVLLSFLWWPLGYAVAFVPRALLAAFRWCIGLLARIPYARIHAGRPILTAWLLFAYLMLILIALGLPKRRGIPLTLAMLAVCLALDTAHSAMFDLEIAVLNVGQGQCVVLRSRGKTAVIDCGGNAGDAGDIAADYLESVGARRIDALILTHLHSDHADGLPTLLSRTDVREIYIPGHESPESVERAHTSVERPLALEVGSARLTLIPSGWQGDDNERCMTAVCTSGAFSFVTTGDLGAPAERWLTRVANLPTGGVLLAGHHGSAGASSEEYIGAVAPQAAVVSVGRNGFGHPAQETLERLEAAGCRIYRTDLDGHVLIRVP